MDGDEATQKLFRKNPFKNASIVSKYLHCWMLPLFIQGVRREITEKDLFRPLTQQQSATLGNRLDAEWKKESTKRNPSLLRCLTKMFALRFWLLAIPKVISEALKISHPISLWGLLVYYRPGQTSVSRDEAMMYAGLIFGASLMSNIITHFCMFQLFELGMQVRVACSSLIYRKALRLSHKSLGETTVGQIVNLLSSDVNRFNHTLINLHNIWVVPIEFAVVCYLMYIYVGFTSAVGAALLTLYIPLQLYLVKTYTKLRRKTAVQTDNRVRLMNEILNGIQVIKMYTWEIPFAKLVDTARKIEIKYIRTNIYITGVWQSLAIISTRLAVFVTILTFVLLDNVVTADYVFVIFSFYSVVRQALTVSFPAGIAQLAETRVSLQRLNKFLTHAEIDRGTNAICNGDTMISKVNETIKLSQMTLTSGDNSITKDNKMIKLKNVTASWSTETAASTLSQITFTTSSNQLLAVMGAVGSSKSSLLQLLLKELPVTEGSLQCHGTISYASQEPWLFGATVRQNILFGQPYDKQKYQQVVRACALERDFRIFAAGDNTLVGERGIMVSGGQKARIGLARAIYKDADIYLLDDPLSAVDTHVGRQLFDNCITGYLKNKCVVLVTHQLQYLRNVNKIILLEDGVIKAEGDYKQINDMNLNFLKSIKNDTEDEDEISDIRKLKTLESVQEQMETQKQEQELRKTGRIPLATYKTYVKSCGSYCSAFAIIVSFLLVQIASSGADYFITYWVNMEQNHSTYIFNETFTDEEYLYMLPRSHTIYIYSGIMLFTIIISLIRAIGFYLLCMKSSIKMHDQMFNGIAHAQMRFFHTNPCGRVLNRFSKDIGVVDDSLPHTLADTLQIGLNVIGIAVVIGVVNLMFIPVTIVILLVFYLMRKVYLGTSMPIKRLESTTKSPVFTHVSASLQGLVTIRAYDAQILLQKEFDNYQDKHTAAYFMSMSASRTFGFYMDMICTIYIGVVTFSFFYFPVEGSGSVGLAITQSLSLTVIVQWGMRQWSELENQMTSIERVVEYAQLTPEKEIATTSRLPKVWPKLGHMEFDKLYLRYNQSDPYVLKHLSFIVQPCEKIGIVGRTGAGKSSLITALFQLTETEGEIIIDGINIREVSLTKLRSSISIIPQEPVLFSGTIQKNLDPFGEYDDTALWSALDEVNLKLFFAELPGGLHARIQEGGSNLSVGQRQLICLARAILRNNKILVLDEATANVDPQTDFQIQQTIRRKFRDCTVLTIAHRLNTIMDSDKVLVLDVGEIREFDHPYVLLQHDSGLFKAMVDRTGRGNANMLTRIAEQAFKDR